MNPFLKPAGVGDLLITKQRLTSYDLGEFAHSENVMGRELRMREHQRRRLTETVIEEDIENIKETENELQTTERFETKAEVERVISQESAFSAGLDVSAGYGPVSVSLYGNYSSGSSMQDSRSNSVKYSKEVVEKAVSRIQDRVRIRRTDRVIEEVIESNKHGFDNRSSNSPVNGIYQWIDKYYLNKVVNYGKRLFFEFEVPEPAAFLIFARNPELQGTVPVRPEEPTNPETGDPLQIEDLDEMNYLAIAGQYGFENVEPPPAFAVVQSSGTGKTIGAQPGRYAFVLEDIEVPDGYEAIRMIIRAWDWHKRVTTTMIDNSYICDIKVGRRHYRDFNLESVPGGLTIPLAREVGRLPIVISGLGQSIKSVSAVVECFPTRNALRDWQTRTYAAVMGGYNQVLQRYNEQMAALAIQSGVQIVGDNPAKNRIIEKGELKRACLALIRMSNDGVAPRIDQFTSAAHPNNYPRTNFANTFVAGHEISFYESIFEWENMTYEFRDYSYGRLSEWVNLVNLKDVDPVFEKFLQSGSVKVRIPARPELEKSALFFAMTGRAILDQRVIPRLSTIAHPHADLYNGYLDDLGDTTDIVEIDEDVDFDESDEDTWEVKIPTNLVFLSGAMSFPVEF